MILAIDPSIRHLGWATIHSATEGRYRHGTINIPEGTILPRVLTRIIAKLPSGTVDMLIVEYPEFFQGSQKGAVAAVSGSTFGLAAIAGFLQGWFQLPSNRVKHYRPSEWKGQIPKAGMMYRFHQRFGYAAPNDHEAEAMLLLDHYLTNL